VELTVVDGRGRRLRTTRIWVACTATWSSGRASRSAPPTTRSNGEQIRALAMRDALRGVISRTCRFPGGTPSRRKRGDGHLQRPIVVLAAQLSDPQNRGVVPWDGVRVLFHELGHVMHCTRLRP
jgi:hypothetical protein